MMVSEYGSSQLLLVLQIDHSRVAGYLAAHWGNDMFSRPTPYASMVLAAQEHDNGWWDWEVRPSNLNGDGYPLDYHDGTLKYIGEQRLSSTKRGVHRVTVLDPYAGLIVLMHNVGLLNAGYGRLNYLHDRTSDPRVQEYIHHQEGVRHDLLVELRQSEVYGEFATEEQIAINFKLMETFDLMAQFLCNHYPLNRTGRRNRPTATLNDAAVPVGPGHDDTTLAIDALDQTCAIVRPYPYDKDPLNISFPGRLIPRRRYASTDDFLEHFYKAERISVSYVLKGS